MPIDIESQRPRSALLRGVHITEFKGHVINPDPIILKETDFLLEEFLSPTKLKALTGVDDLASVEDLEMIVDTSETSLGNFGIYLPNLRQLKLNGSHVPRIRDLGTSLVHLTVLWLSRSGLVDLDGISTLNSLRELYLAYNDIADISACSLLDNLVCLDLEGNLIDDLKQVEFLNLCVQLSHLTLYGNPICVKPNPDSIENDPDYSYRHEVIKILPSLRVLDDELTLNTNAKSPTKVTKSKSRSHNESCPFDDDWQLINKILEEGIGPSEEKLAINESMRPATGSSTSGGSYNVTSRTATGVRPLSVMRPLSSYRMKTPACRPTSRHSLSTSSSSRVSTSTPPLAPLAVQSQLDDVSLLDGQHSDASQLTVGPTFHGNPLKALLARKKPLAFFNPIQPENQSSNKAKAIQAIEEAATREVQLENQALRDELEKWKREHTRRLEERKSYFEPQVLIIDDDDNNNQSDLDTNTHYDDDDDEGRHTSISYTRRRRPKSAFKSSFDCDEAVVAVGSVNEEKQSKPIKKKHHIHKEKPQPPPKPPFKLDAVSLNLNTSTNNCNNHQPIIVATKNNHILKPLSQQTPNGLNSLRQLKTNLTPLPEIRLPK